MKQIWVAQKAYSNRITGEQKPDFYCHMTDLASRFRANVEVGNPIKRCESCFSFPLTFIVAVWSAYRAERWLQVMFEGIHARFAPTNPVRLESTALLAFRDISCSCEVDLTSNGPKLTSWRSSPDAFSCLLNDAKKMWPNYHATYLEPPRTSTTFSSV